MIGASSQMLVDQPPDLRPVEISAFERALREQRVLRQLAHRPSEPLPDRDAESHLAPVDVLGRQHVGERALEQTLQSPASEFDLDRQSRGEFHDLVIKKRRTRLQAVGHRSDVDLHQQVVRQIRRDVDGHRGVYWMSWGMSWGMRLGMSWHRSFELSFQRTAALTIQKAAEF